MTRGAKKYIRLFQCRGLLKFALTPEDVISAPLIFINGSLGGDRWFGQGRAIDWVNSIRRARGAGSLAFIDEV